MSKVYVSVTVVCFNSIRESSEALKARIPQACIVTTLTSDGLVRDSMRQLRADRTNCSVDSKFRYKLMAAVLGFEAR